MKSRNRLQRISFLAVSLAALVHGCAWDDSLYNEFVIQNEDGSEEVVRCGDSLEKIIIYKGNNASETYCRECTNGYGKYANAFEYNLCPRDAPNCIKLANDEQPNTTKGICHSCPEGYAVCKGKCLEMAPKSQETDSDKQNHNIKFNPSLHIQSCDNDNLVCDDDYHDVDGDIANGCEYPLRPIHVKKDSEDKFVCDDNDYYDLNGDLENLKDHKSSDGCEFQLSSVHVDKSVPQKEDGSWNCIEDYYDFDQEATNGCEFQLSLVNVDKTNPKNGDGFWKCIEDYYDFDQEATNGCEFQLSLVNVDKTNPITSNSSDFSWNCKDGYADLDESRKNGCEINGWMDSEHCGEGIIIDREQGTRRKGEVCINGKTCIMGECKVSCGQEGIIECGGYCVNVKGSDNAHCGACAQTCELDPTTNRRTSTAAVACGGGYCHAIACNPGYKLVKGTPNTCAKCDEGYYTTSAKDTECTKCPKTPGASTMKFDATLNMCVPKNCENGWYHYDPCKNSGQQTCTEPAYCDTTQHCKSKSDCATLTYGSSSCVDGKCKYACNAGYYYLKGCDKSPYCCFACPHGTYSSTGATQCSIVPAGYVANNCASGYDGCTDYSRCSSKDACINMYVMNDIKCDDGLCYTYYSPPSSSNGLSCNRSYNGCPNSKTCKPYDNNYQYSYGYCN